MATTLPNAVTLTYNGIQFPNSTEVQVNAQMVYDSANRAVVRVNYTLTAKATIAMAISGLEGNDIGDDVVELRKALTKPGGRLVYTDAGFGDLKVNVTNADCAWGPRPRMLSWRPKGLKEACEVTWQVEFSLAECDPDSTGIPLGSIRPPMEFCYRISWSIDDAGYTRRTYAGHVAVAQTRKSATDRTLSDNADRLREQIDPAVPYRFRRASRDFALSEDKCRLDFTIVDEQCPPNVLPRGVLKCRASHTVETQNLAMLQWSGTLSASYELPYHYPRSDAAFHFMDLLKDRIDHTRKALLNQRIVAGAAGGVAGFLGGLLGGASLNGLVIPRRFSMGEPDIYGRETATFSMSYTMTLSSWALGYAMEAFGLFRPTPNQNWNEWRLSLATPSTNGIGGPWATRGSAGLRFDNKEDQILDLCLNLGKPIPLGGAGGKADPKVTTRRPPVASPFNEELKPVNSWLEYFNVVEVEQVDSTSEARLLPVDEVVVGNTDTPVASGSGGYQIPYAGSGQGNLIQVVGRPSVAVILRGRALRAGYGIAPPQVTGVGGKDAVPGNRRGREFFRTGVVGNAPYPICAASWCLRWILPSVPAGRITAPPNPMMGQLAEPDPVQFAMVSND